MSNLKWHFKGKIRDNVFLPGEENGISIFGRDLTREDAETATKPDVWFIEETLRKWVDKATIEITMEILDED